MEQDSHRYIEATFKMSDNNDETQTAIQETAEGKPLQFYTGLGMIIGGLEKLLSEVESDTGFEFVVPAADAFGEYNDDMVVNVTKESFCVDGKFDDEHVYVGATLPLQNEQGMSFMGRVKAIGENDVTIDLNHPLAGKDLKFVGHMIENRIAPDEEIEGFKKLMHNHKCGSHCGGGCGNCDSGNCCGDCK